MQCLRRETRAEHEAIEQALDWQARASSRERYRHWLERLYGFHRSWEPAVAEALAAAGLRAPRSWLHLLADDLARLRGPAWSADLLPSPPQAPFATVAEALGSMYVLEGSALGGQLIARHVVATLGFTPAYHGGDCALTGATWRAFQSLLEREIGESEVASAVASARSTFSGLRAWLTA